jgi:glycerol-3-phosphate dehydrogenase
MPISLRRWRTGRGADRSCEVTGGAFDGAPGGSRRHRAGAGRLVINAAGLWGDRLDERPAGRARLHHPPAQGPVHRLRQVRRRACPPHPAARADRGDQGHRRLPHRLGQPPRRPHRRGAGGPRAADLPRNACRLQRAARRSFPRLEGPRDHRRSTPVSARRRNTRTTASAPMPGRSWSPWAASARPGLSAALGIAAHVARLAAGRGTTGPAPGDRVAAGAEHLRRRPTRLAVPGHGGIVCHCELVTRREIEAALSGPLAARSARRAQAPHARDDGPLPGVPLPRPTRPHDRGRIRVADGGGGRWMTCQPRPIW